MSEYETITLTPVSSTLGARIEGVDLGTELTDRQFAEIHSALLEHHVIFFRGQDISEEQHKAFAGRFGRCRPHPIREILGDSETLAVVENDADKPPQDDNHWHTDYSFHSEVPDVAVLRSRIVPPVGGDTLFANTVAAYAALSPAMQAFLEGLEAFHDAGPKFAFEMNRTLGEEVSRRVLKEFPGRAHPVVVTHPETGRRALFVNPGYTRRVIGLHPDESDALLRFLFDHIDSPGFHCRYRWEENDIAVWDERSTLHQGPDDFYPHHRRLQRVTAGAWTPALRT